MGVFMKNTFKIVTFIVMLTGLSTAAFAQKTVTIVIQGIPKLYNGMIGMLALTPPGGNSQKYTAYSLVKLESPATKFPLSDFATDKPWVGGGNFAVTLLIYDNVDAVKRSQYKFHYQTAATTNINQIAVNMQWSQFLSMEQQRSEVQPSMKQPPQPAVEQKSITISGIPGNYRGKVAMLSIAPSPNSQNYTAYSLGTISGNSVTFPLSDFKTDNPWGGSGNFAFIILIGDNAQAIADKQYIYVGQTAATSSVNQNTTTVQWSQFLSTVQQEPQPLKPQPLKPQPVQKSITLKGFPGNYKGKVAMLALAPSANNQNYVAYSLGTISGMTVTFPLSDWTTDKPWVNSGNFVFVILIGDNAQAIANRKYLYTAQTTATTNVSQDETVISWSEFVFMKAQEPLKPQGKLR